MAMSERAYSTLENNKGMMCPYRQIRCQEGFCPVCQVYLEWKRRDSPGAAGTGRLRARLREGEGV